VAPQLNCVTFQNGTFVTQCGDETGNNGATGNYFIQWLPNTDNQEPVTQYTIYVKAGMNTVSVTNYDFIYFVNSSTHYFLTPQIGTGCKSFLVTASNSCGLSLPSAIFNSSACSNQ
jgi:hypothetical protein